MRDLIARIESILKPEARNRLHEEDRGVAWIVFDVEKVKLAEFKAFLAAGAGEKRISAFHPEKPASEKEKTIKKVKVVRLLFKTDEKLMGDARVNTNERRYYLDMWKADPKLGIVNADVGYGTVHDANMMGESDEHVHEEDRLQEAKRWGPFKIENREDPKDRRSVGVTVHGGVDEDGVVDVNITGSMFVNSKWGFGELRGGLQSALTKMQVALLSKNETLEEGRFMREIEDFILAAGEEDLKHIEKFITIRRKQLGESVLHEFKKAEGEAASEPKAGKGDKAKGAEGAEAPAKKVKADEAGVSSLLKDMGVTVKTKDRVIVEVGEFDLEDEAKAKGQEVVDALKAGGVEGELIVNGVKFEAYVSIT